MSARRRKLKKRSGRQKKSPDWELILKVLGLVVAVGTLIIGFIKFREDREKPQKDRRIEVYNKLMSAAALFSEATDMNEADRARKEFRSIYKGQLNEVKDEVVSQVADRFSLALIDWENCHKSPEDKFTKPRNFLFEDPVNGSLIRFGRLAQELSEACRVSLEKHE